jgi:hypothetical protein
MIMVRDGKALPLRMLRAPRYPGAPFGGAGRWEDDD